MGAVAPKRPPARAVQREHRHRRNVNLSPSTEHYLLVLGDGNLSLGIEKLVGDRPFRPEFLQTIEARQKLLKGAED